VKINEKIDEKDLLSVCRLQTAASRRLIKKLSLGTQAEKEREKEREIERRTLVVANT